MEVDVGQHGRDKTSLRSSGISRAEYPILQYAGFKKALDRAQDARVADSVFQEPHEVFVADIGEESLDVCLDDPLRVLCRNNLRHASERIMRSSVGTKTIRALPELRFPYRLQDLTQPILDDAVLEARYPKRSNAPVGFGDIHTPRWLWAISHPPQAGAEIRNAVLSTHCVGILPHPVDSNRLVRRLSVEAVEQSLGVEQHPHQGCEPQLWIISRHLCEARQMCCHGASGSVSGPCSSVALS